LVALEKMINKTENASKKLMKKIKTSEIYAFERLVALYKLSWLGSMSFLASAESIYELFKRKAALKHILAYDENILEDLEKNKNSLHKLLDRLNTQKKEKLNLEANYKKQIRIMSHKEKKRSKLLADIRNKKSLEMALIESLKEAANSLNQTMKSLSIGIDHPKQKQLTINFASYKGLLNMPVQGKIVSHFGPYKSSKFNITYFRKGIDIKADRGEPIRAVCAGKILYSDWFKGYGNMIIIDHGDNYYTVYAHAEEIFKTKGNTVETKEVIATVGDTGSIIGPGLYFEVRYHGKPMNPLVWIRKG
jgi:septal ring factor EnvC (AmiA/AmiB activator)